MTIPKQQALCLQVQNDVYVCFLQGKLQLNLRDMIQSSK